MKRIPNGNNEKATMQTMKAQLESERQNSTMPDYAPAQCINEDCGWEGGLGDCPTGWEQESWETESYQVALCPVCGEEVEIR